MAKHSSNILELAARGARQKYDELQAEIASLVRQFPSLRKGGGIVTRGRKAVAAAVAELKPRKRRKLSAKARKAIGDAQRRRWAKVKAESK